MVSLRLRITATAISAQKMLSHLYDKHEPSARVSIAKRIDLATWSRRQMQNRPSPRGTSFQFLLVGSSLPSPRRSLAPATSSRNSPVAPEKKARKPRAAIHAHSGVACGQGTASPRRTALRPRASLPTTFSEGGCHLKCVPSSLDGRTGH
jgi:hypothetical protein